MTIKLSRTAVFSASGLTFKQVISAFTPYDGGAFSITSPHGASEVLALSGFDAESTLCIPNVLNAAWKVRLAVKRSKDFYFIDPQDIGRGWYLMREDNARVFSLSHSNGVVMSAWSSPDPHDSHQLVWEVRLEMPIDEFGEYNTTHYSYVGFMRALNDETLSIVPCDPTKTDEMLRLRGEIDVLS
jgi:hypothetical protein